MKRGEPSGTANVRMPTGVPGLDELLSGGFPRNRCILLYGDPGSGKTTFALQFLLAGATEFSEPGIFVTLTEDPNEIKENMLSFGWDLTRLEKQRKLAIIDARPVTSTKDGIIAPSESLFKGEILPFSHISQIVMQHAKKLNAKRLAIDSVTVLTMQYVNRFYVRQGLLGLIQSLSSRDSTAILIVEAIREERNAPLEFALTPGVVSLGYVRKGNAMVRSLQINKMRGVKHGEQVYLMEIADRGIVVHPEVRVEL